MAAKRDISSNLKEASAALIKKNNATASYIVDMEVTATARTARANAQILWINWHGVDRIDKGGRHMKTPPRRPWFTSAAEWNRIQREFQKALIEGKGTLDDAARKVGDLTKEIYEKHVKEGKNQRGIIAPLSPGYKKWKDEKYPGRPVMVRSGQLLKSIRPKVEKV
jgi:hypothetical protein